MKRTLLFFIAIILYGTVAAQTPLQKGDVVPQGAVVYALPATEIEVQVEAVHEVFTAGPYARYAQKYLGIEADAANKETCRLQSIAVQAKVEADPSQLYFLEIKGKNEAANFLKFSNNGLIVSLDAAAQPVKFRYAHTPHGKFNDRGVETNLSTDKVTLYKPGQTDAGFEKVSVQQNQLVEKNPERRAEEAARFIFDLRKKRVELITGDAEHDMNSDGLRAALDEIRRLEEEYLSLFLGKTTHDVQSAVFFVTPVAAQQTQLYVTFRLSDTQGLLPADNLAGRPVTLELTADKSADELPDNAADKGNSKLPRLTYRLPATTQVRINDGQTNLLQTRLPIYQFGKTMTFPVNLQVK
jgi:hypothetical protein